eukprot:363630-Chlamydomonas_euryale.AAC.9
MGAWLEALHPRAPCVPASSAQRLPATARLESAPNDCSRSQLRTASSLRNRTEVEGTRFFPAPLGRSAGRLLLPPSTPPPQNQHICGGLAQA